MTDEEVQQAIQEVNKSLDNLPESDDKAPSQQRQVLLLKKEVLQKVKEAREEGNKNQEVYNSVYYSLLDTWGEKHPYMVYLMMSRFKWCGM